MFKMLPDPKRPLSLLIGIMIWSTLYGNVEAKVQMLPTIPALLPSLVADQVSIVQAIDRPQAQVYYMNIKNSTAKGSLSAAGDLITAKTGHASSQDARGYASDEVWAEANVAGSGAQTLILTATKFKPLLPGSITVSGLYTTVGGMAAIETFTDDYNGTTVLTATLTGSRGSTGSYNTVSGVITLDAGGGNTINNTAVSSVRYRYDVEKCTHTDRIGGINLEVVSENVDARTFPLRLDYNIFAAINLQKIHGMVLADEGIKTLCHTGVTLYN